MTDTQMTDTQVGRTVPPDSDRLLAYVADLELEVDRLRRQGRFIERNAAETLTKILRLCTAPAAGSPLPALAEIETTARELVEVVRDLHDPPGYHPAHDQVVAVAVRPLVEQSGGTLTATPGEGGGTEFVVTLPRYDLLDFLEVPGPRA